MSSPSRRHSPTIVSMLFALFAALLLNVALSTTASAQQVKTPHVEAELIARHTSFQPGKPIEAALRLKIIDHWHTYWRNPGDSGLPTRLKWTLPPGFVAGEIEWPYPKKLPLGPLMNFGYEGEAMHLVTLQTPASAKLGERVTLSAKADWLVCADVCIPEEGVVTLTLQAGAETPKPDPKWQRSFAAARDALPATLLGGVAVTINGAVATLVGKSKTAVGVSGVAFFPHRDDVMANAVAQVFTRTPDGFTLTVPLADPRINDLKTLDGVLVSTSGAAGWGDGILAQPGANNKARAVSIAAPVSYAVGSVVGDGAKPNPGIDGRFQAKMPESARPDLSLIGAILFAFLGGLILNLMPCVFPVLGIKVMGFVNNAHGEKRLLQQQGAAYFCGVLASFMLLAGLMLALRGAGQSIGWGFQMQEPLFVAALAALFFLMALNLSGLFEFGTSIQSVAGDAELRAQSHPRRGAFASGVLATVVATPCMAPGLGASVGFTLGQSAPVALLIFAAIGIGLALPVSALSFFPASLRYLPKPGAWMDTFKQLMAFPLYATVVWLVWILGAQSGNDGVALLLAALTLLALGAWVYGHWQVAKPRMAIAAGAAAVVCGALLAWTAATLPPPATPSASTAVTDGDWVPFSKESIASLRGQGKSVFVDFTATWCITCQVNKRVALNDAAVIAQMKARNVVRMQADWTRKDNAITAALAEFGRNGVPLYVLYPPVGEPAVLPELLTPAIVLDAIAAIEPATTAQR